MTNTNYIGRFVRHGGKFLWRVGGIFAGVAAASVLEAIKDADFSSDAKDPDIPIYGYLDAWKAFDRGQINASELNHYRVMYHED